MLNPHNILFIHLALLSPSFPHFPLCSDHPFLVFIFILTLLLFIALLSFFHPFVGSSFASSLIVIFFGAPRDFAQLFFLLFVGEKMEGWVVHEKQDDVPRVKHSFE
eukprot:TRINITY_DN3585_c0_g1_i1.p1 TRINITY_DN3585_c0_g1~~TRINITY_DN3585_c0_g1_i1.p1  ORF type:complete len:106 (+),score=27.25 TRINITY_DN3585_c0_g1_i1:297-614(+)